MRTVIRAALSGCLVLCLVACSGTTFVYNRLDTILPWYLNDYVDLDSKQRRQLDETLQQFLRWHREQELPRYIDLLAGIDASLDRPITPAAVGVIYSQAELAWQRLEAESLDWLLQLGDSLSDEQVQEFLAYLEEKQEELEEEFLTRSEPEYRENAYDSFTEGMEDYLGSLDVKQRERLRLASTALQRSDTVWLEEREAWMQRLAVMLQRQPGWQQRVREALANRSKIVSARYQQAYQHNLDVIFAAVADVLNARTEKQDLHLRKELAMLREDLQTLIAQGATDPVPVNPAETNP